jgi:hypothetical protein
MGEQTVQKPLSVLVVSFSTDEEPAYRSLSGPQPGSFLISSQT